MYNSNNPNTNKPDMLWDKIISANINPPKKTLRFIKAKPNSGNSAYAQYSPTEPRTYICTAWYGKYWYSIPDSMPPYSPHISRANKYIEIPASKMPLPNIIFTAAIKLKPKR